MRFEWDLEKAEANYSKHQIRFERAIDVFSDPLHVIQFDRHIDDEDRFHAIGIVDDVLMLLVVHTLRFDHAREVTRIISARRATNTERKTYVKSNQH